MLIISLSPNIVNGYWPKLTATLISQRLIVNVKRITHMRISVIAQTQRESMCTLEIFCTPENLITGMWKLTVNHDWFA